MRAARKAFTSGDWPKLNASRRGALLRKLGDLVGERWKQLAETEVRDNGKLYAEMAGQTKYIEPWFHYYGGLADKIEGSVIPLDKPDNFNFTRHEPLGVIAAIVPGILRCCSPRGSWPPRWRRATPWSSSRRSSPPHRCSSS